MVSSEQHHGTETTWDAPLASSRNVTKGCIGNIPWQQTVIVLKNILQHAELTLQNLCHKKCFDHFHQPPAYICIRNSTYVKSPVTYCWSSQAFGGNHAQIHVTVI